MAQKTSKTVRVLETENDRLEYLFNVLNNAWKKDVMYESSATKIVSHPAYQLIIEMGEVMIPFILNEVSRGSNHWFFALQKISGHTPNDAGTLNFDELRPSWMQWAEEQEKTGDRA